MMNKVQVLNSQLRVDFIARRVQAAPRQIYIQASFSNATSQPISELHFQVAVEKVNLTRPSSSLFNEDTLLTDSSYTRCSFVRNRVETSLRSNRTVCSRTWPWTALTRARATR